MNLKEIFDKILIESGQFLVTSDKIELDIDRFLVLIKGALGFYNCHNPVFKKFNYNASTGGRRVTFTEDTLDLQGNLTGIPDRIVDVVPIRISGISPFFLRNFDSFTNPDLSDKREYPVAYRKPDLYIPFESVIDVEAMYPHVITETTGNDGKKTFELLTIDESHDRFFRLLAGRFLIGLGMNRRAWTIQDIPVISDASELVSEGKDMEKEAREQIQEIDNKWWKAWK